MNIVSLSAAKQMPNAETGWIVARMPNDEWQGQLQIVSQGIGDDMAPIRMAKAGHPNLPIASALAVRPLQAGIAAAVIFNERADKKSVLRLAHSRKRGGPCAGPRSLDD